MLNLTTDFNMENNYTDDLWHDPAVPVVERLRALFLNHSIISPLCLVCARAPHWPHVRQAKFCLRVCRVVFHGVLPSFTIFALSAGFLLTKINIGKTGNQVPPSGGFWLPVFLILIFLKLGTSG